MDIRRLKMTLRNDPFFAWCIYLVKYVFLHRFQRYMELIRIKLGIIKSKAMAEKIRKLKGSKTGQACLIVGNGPSLKLDELDLLQDCGIDTFGSNRILDIFHKTKWRPTYLCVMDPGFLLGIHNTTTPEEYLRKATEEKSLLFFTRKLYKHFPAELRDAEKNYYFDCCYAEIFSINLPPFSDNIPLYIADLGSVTHFAIQLACYMGYKTIYLYGMDNTFPKYLDDAGRFVITPEYKMHAEGIKTDDSEIYADVVPKSNYEAFRIGGFADVRKNNLGYKACKKYAQEHDIKIINVTHGGLLDVFERQSMNEVVGLKH